MFSRPHPGFSDNGDAYLLQSAGDGRTLLAVVDGLGHGPDACRAAQAAVAYLGANAERPLDGLLRGCHLRLQGTRGAAVALARIDCVAAHLSYCGVGNVEARLLGPHPTRPISYNGIVGAVIPRFRVFEFPFPAGTLLLMHSDGISARFDLAGYAGLVAQPAQLIADVIGRDFARAHDDATLVAIRHTGGEGC